jgi:hypothetical protein
MTITSSELQRSPSGTIPSLIFIVKDHAQNRPDHAAAPLGYNFTHPDAPHFPYGTSTWMAIRLRPGWNCAYPIRGL